ncbi:MAG: ester cyclase, partial [Gemmatimonadota bacterium]
MMLERLRRSTALGPAVAVLCLLPVAACTSGEAGLDAEAMTEFGARYTTAWSSHDPVSVASFYGANGSLTVNDGDPAVGREAIAAVAQGFMTAFPDLVLEMDSVRVAASSVQYHWTFAGTNTGPGGTGNAVRFSGYEEWTMGPDGLVAESQGHFDEAEYTRQLEVGFGVMDGEALSADGVPIRYEVHGTGDPALVLVHGWTNSRAIWGVHPRTLANTHRVVALDLAGHG